MNARYGQASPAFQASRRMADENFSLEMIDQLPTVANAPQSG